jgi:hypothetical protein
MKKNNKVSVFTYSLLGLAVLSVAFFFFVEYSNNKSVALVRESLLAAVLLSSESESSGSSIDSSANTAIVQAILSTMPETLTGRTPLPAWASTLASIYREEVVREMAIAAPPGISALGAITNAVGPYPTRNTHFNRLSAEIGQQLTSSYGLPPGSGTNILNAVLAGQINLTINSLHFNPGPAYLLGFGSSINYSISNQYSASLKNISIQNSIQQLAPKKRTTTSTKK